MLHKWRSWWPRIKQSEHRAYLTVVVGALAVVVAGSVTPDLEWPLREA